MSKKPKIERNKTFQGSLNNALHAYLQRDEKHLAGDFWHSDAMATAVENADRAMKSLAVLRKHLPKQFHPLIRFAQPKTVWFLNVEKGVTATQLNMLLDDLLLIIAKDIGFAPRIQVAVQPSHLRWSQSGFPLQFPEKTFIERPAENEAQSFLSDFIKNNL